MVRLPTYRPDLPDFGVYARWPAPGISWIHPHDVSTAVRLIPSQRVFERVRFDDSYYHLRYGSLRLRVRPSMWTRVPQLDARVGDQVELLSDFGRFDPGIATITDVFANYSHGGFEFVVRRGNMKLPHRLERDHFRVLTKRYCLRSGHFDHQPARFCPPADIELLDVGNLS